MFQKIELRKRDYKIVPNMRNINQARGGRSVIRKFPDRLDAAPVDPSQDETVVGTIAMIRGVEKQS